MHVLILEPFTEQISPTIYTLFWIRTRPLAGSE